MNPVLPSEQKYVAAAECPAYLLDLRELALLIRSNDMLFIYHPTRGAFVNAFENLKYDEVVAQGLYEFGSGRRLEPDEVRLPRQARDLLGYAQQTLEAPDYGLRDEWRNNLLARGPFPLEPPGAADDAAIKQFSSLAFCVPAAPVTSKESASQAARVMDLKRSLDSCSVNATPTPADSTPSAGASQVANPDGSANPVGASDLTPSD